MASTGTNAAAPLDQRLRPMWEAVRRPSVRVVTTDVFDTVLWRQVPEPADAFALVGQRLQDAGLLGDGLTPMAFAHLRAEAEKRARELLSDEHERHEVRLEEIYALLPSWVAQDNRRALEVELEVEHDLLVPDLDVLALLLAAKDAGKRVVAVSDTYFTEPMLRGLLDQPELRELQWDAVYASSEHRLGKSGGLFEIVLRELAVEPEAVVHMGDNEEADVEFPSELGIECTVFERIPPALGRILDAERLQRVSAPVPGRSPAGVAPDLTSLRGKLAAREERAAVAPALRPFWDHGALVQGPVFTGFAEWVQERAAALDVSTVHGFMREGGFLGSLVDRAGEYLGTGVRARPLWLNRAVLSAASIGEVTPEALAPLLVRRRTPSVGRFLRGIGLSPSDLPRFATHADTSLDDGITRENLLAAIEADGAAAAKVLAHAQAMRERVVAYVQREIADDGRLVCLDLGWAGSAQGLLGQVLEQAGLELEVTGLYLALHEGGARRVFEGQRALGFLAEFGFPGDKTEQLVRSPEVLEQICMPDFGSQVGLDADLQPVLDELSRDPVQAAQAEAVRDGVRAFQAEWARYQLALPGKLAPLADARERLRPILTRAVTAPTGEEAGAFGRWLHDENQGSDAMEAVIDARQAEVLKHMDPAGLRELPMNDLYWPFGVAAQVDPTWPALLDAAVAGTISWDALSAEVETGPFTVAISGGAMYEPDDVVGGVAPKRNRFGLSAVHGTLRAGAITELAIQPCDEPAILRFDVLELRCYSQGQAAPTILRFDEPAHFAQLRRQNVYVVNPNVFVCHSNSHALFVDVGAAVAGHVVRVDVHAGFALLPIGELLPTPGRIRSVEEAGVRVEHLERVLADLQGSLSWRVTKPLRAAKRGTGR